MMSMTSVSGSSGASSYYEVDDYYSEDNKEQHTQLSEWHGKGAALLGLQGAVKGDDFRAILDGNLPNGQTLGRWVKDSVMGGGKELNYDPKTVVEKGDNGEKRVHRSGLDLTFSPPKSVAIMAQVYGDTRIIDEHKAAVKETLDLIERTAAKSRVTRAGITQDEKTGNLAVATFFHTATRNQDPGMHSHAVMTNATLCDDGKWRSLDNSDIWKDSKAKFGEFYSMTLAHKLQKNLGYEIHAKGKNAEYEIAGVSQRVIDYFSTRSQDIKALMEDRGLEGPKSKEWAALLTRGVKTVFDKALETDAWKERAAKLGVDLSGLVEDAKTNIEESKKQPTEADEKKHKEPKEVGYALSAVKDAADALSQRQSTFTRKELVQAARNFAVGYAQDKDIGSAIKRLESNEQLLAPGKDKSLLTTKQTVALENDNLLRIKMGKGEFSSMAQYSNIDQLSESYTLNRSQDRTLRTLANSTDRYTGFQGWAGVGKTHWAKPFRTVIESSGHQAIGLSASAQAAKGLERGSGIPSNTLASFLHENRALLDPETSAKSQQENAAAINKGEKQRPFIVVDESSFISSKDMNSLLKVAEGLDARVLFMGDYKQLEGVDAGRPYSQMIANDMETGRSTEIVRQKDLDLRRAVYSVIDSKFDKALDGMSIIESPVAKDYEDQIQQSKAMGEKPDIDYSSMRADIRSDLISKAANTFLSLDQESRDNTLLVAPTNEIRENINDIVRSAYIQEGSISADGISLDIYKGKGLTDGAMRHAHNYEPGNVIRFNTPSRHHGISRGDYFTVTSNSQEANGERYIELASRDDPTKTATIHPRELASRGQGAVEVFETKTREIAEGDSIRWTRNDKPNDLINSESAKIVELNKGSGIATMQLESGEIRDIDLTNSKHRHFDYNIALTTHAAQGATYDRTIAVAESYSGFMTNQQSFYVQASRSVWDTIIVTDNQQKLIETLGANSGYESTALSLYNNRDMPLDFTLMDSLQEQVGDGVSLKEIYNNALVSLDGDVSATHDHLQALGVDVDKLEQDILIEHEEAQMEQPDANVDHGMSDPQNEQGADPHKQQDAGMHSDSEADQGNVGATPYDLNEMEMSRDIESHKIVEMHESGELSFVEAMEHLAELGINSDVSEELLTSTGDYGYFDMDDLELTNSVASNSDELQTIDDVSDVSQDSIEQDNPYDRGFDIDD